MTNPVTLTTKIYQQQSFEDCIKVVVESMPQKIAVSSAFNTWKISTGVENYRAMKTLQNEIGQTIFAICCDASKRLSVH